jgi:NitT/TauT family transport system ATP-binding protein
VYLKWFYTRERACPALTGLSTARLATRRLGRRNGHQARTKEHLDNVDLDVNEGEFVCLLGPSGCGKSTLLDIIAGLTMPGAGRVLAGDQLVQGRAGTGW